MVNSRHLDGACRELAERLGARDVVVGVMIRLNALDVIGHIGSRLHPRWENDRVEVVRPIDDLS